MQTTAVIDYARRLHAAHGDRAEAEAAQKAVACEKAGDSKMAETWRQVRAAIAQMRPVHNS